MKTWRRVALGGLTVFQLGLASVPATAQVTILPDNEARRAIRALQDKLLELELGTRDRITAVDAALKASIGSVQQESKARSDALALESKARSDAVALQALKRLEASELVVREAIDRLAAVLNQRIDGVNASGRDELNRQSSELRALHGVLKDNQVVLQGDMKGQALKQDEFNREVAARLQQFDKETGVLKANQEVLQADIKDQVRKHDAFAAAAAGRLQDLDIEIGALKTGRVEVSRAIDQLREDAQKWLAPLQTSLDQLTRDLTIAQRALRDQATSIADIQRKADEAQRKVDERIKDLDEAQREGLALWQRTLAERDARHEQKLADAARDSELKSQQSEERLRRAAEELARRFDERSARLEQALRQAQERADKADALIAQADARLAEADRRLAEAERRSAEADRRLAAIDKNLSSVDERLTDNDKRLGEAEGRVTEAEKQLTQTDARLGDNDAKRAQADERAREVAERLGRIDEALRRSDDRQAQGESRVSRIDERALRMETRWRVVDEQARQRGMEADLSPLGQRVGQIEDRLRKLEPLKVLLDGEELSVQPEEKRSYDDAIDLMVKGDYVRAGELFSQFLRRHPSSGYTGWVRFWRGQALMGQREYRSAISSFRNLVNELPNHPKAPEAMLGMATSQAELKDRAGARKTLEDLLRLYPDSDASKLGRQRLVSMK